ncbi:RNA-binding protein NOB1-like [Montipora capricornis]|uniref:RNA-binding protein NOB1-like n=1 Tax=Montipora foliosa TaxID=591990 RepID=UPI0035F15DAF
MAKETHGKVQFIVADSAAFLKNTPMHNMCENVYTVEEVVNEIRDKETRRRLSVLPYSLHFKQPSVEALQAVTEFSKLTGDFKTLSAVDLRILALTYQLEKENCGTDHIRTTPSKQVGISQGFNGKVVPGFYVEKKLEEEELRDSDLESQEEDEDINTPISGNMDCIQSTVSDRLQDVSGATVSGEPFSSNFTPNGERTEKESEDCSDWNSNVDDGWITPDNISHAKSEMGKSVISSASAINVVVGCLTTDFAMQNVLIQMGLHVISLDGMLIREARSYVLKCHACFRVTSQLQKKFCPWCGNNTLLRIPVIVDDHGVTHYQIPNKKRPFNIRGKKFPLPSPKGGRQGIGPVLTEDQPRCHQRLPRNRDRANVFDADYIARASPFLVKDVTSRASHLGYHVKGSRNKGNPNEVRKKGTRSKRT